MNKNYQFEFESEEAKKTFELILKELEIPNIVFSLMKGNFILLKQTHDSIVEITRIATKLPMEIINKFSLFLVVYLPHSVRAFGRSFIDALSGYYCCAFTLLRHSVEGLIKGAHYECLAREKYRNIGNIEDEIKKRGETIKTIKWWINSQITKNPLLKDEIEKSSVILFDEMEKMGILEEKDTSIYSFNYSEKIQHLNSWKILDPIEDPEKEWRQMYDFLSKEAHCYPLHTEFGKLLSQEGIERIYSIGVLPKQLNTFFKFLHKALDWTIVILLNILKEEIETRANIKEWLKKELTHIELALKLKYSSLKIKNLIIMKK